MLNDAGIAVWRFHDHMHMDADDGIFTGFDLETGWGSFHLPEDECPSFYGRRSNKGFYRLPRTTLRELAGFLKTRFAMGREDTALWYEAVPFAEVRVLLIEWTHCNSDHLHGVDIPVLLNSTPSETLAYRKARHRDGGADSPFTTMVLALEQKQLELQAHKAKLILSKGGMLLPYRDYRRLMAEE